MLKQLISKDVWEYIEKTGFRFSDMDIATIIHHSELSIPEKQCALRSLADRTEDLDLRQQIAERIAYDKMCYERFASNDGSCFYQTSAAEVTERWDLDEATGHFSSVELALSHAKSLGIAFSIHKYQIIGLCESIIVPHGYINPRLCPEGTFEGRSYDGEPIAGFRYNADGELQSYWTYEVTNEENAAVDDWGAKRFEWKFIQMPNPFEKGDIVRLTNSEQNGIVATSQEEWQSFLRRVEERNLVVDFSDASIVVEFQEGSHGHIQPIYLEKVEVDEDTKTRLHGLIDN